MILSILFYYCNHESNQKLIMITSLFKSKIELRLLVIGKIDDY